MIPCNLCSPLDERGERCNVDAQGKWLLGIKQVGKMKYEKNGFVFKHNYRCQDCGARWRLVGNLGTVTT